MKETIKDTYKKLKKKWIENKWGKKIGNAVLIIFVVGAVIFMAVQIGILIYKNMDLIIFSVFGIVLVITCSVAWWRWLFPQKKPTEETPPIRQRGNKPIYLQQHLVNEFMFSLFNSLSVSLHIKKPDMMSEIMDKVDMYTDNTTNVTYFRYNVIISGEVIEKNLFEEILRKGIEKGLASSTSKLGNPVVEYNNKYYPKLAIEEVEFTGASWRVVVAIVDSDYAIVLEERAQKQPFIDNQDDFTFYDDGDFL